MLKKKKSNAGAPRKWNLAKAKSMFMMGMTREEILKEPEYQGMSPKYFDKVRWQERWAVQKEEIQKAALVKSNHVLRDTVDTWAKEQEEHTKFMTVALRRARAHYLKTLPANGISALKGQLDALEKYNNIAIKALHIKDESPRDDHAAGAALLSLLHTSEPGSQALVTLMSPRQGPAVLTLAPQQEVTMGNASEKNVTPKEP